MVLPSPQKAPKSNNRASCWEILSFLHSRSSQKSNNRAKLLAILSFHHRRRSQNSKKQKHRWTYIVSFITLKVTKEQQPSNIFGNIAVAAPHRVIVPATSLDILSFHHVRKSQKSNNLQDVWPYCPSIMQEGRKILITLQLF